MSDQLPNHNDPAGYGTYFTNAYNDLEEWLRQYNVGLDMQFENTTEDVPVVPQVFSNSSFWSNNGLIFPQQNPAFDVNADTGPSLQESSEESCNSSPSLSPSSYFSQSRQSTPESDCYSPPPSPRLEHEVTGATQSGRSSPITSCSCPICNDTFSCVKVTIIHILRHSGVRNNSNHPCPLCDSSFSREQDVKRHLLSHFAVRNELCSRCSKTFKRRDSLIRHQRKCNLK